MDEKKDIIYANYFQTNYRSTQTGFPYINKCLDEIDKAADSIDPNTDAEIVVGKLKSGYEPPGDIPFEELIPTKVDEKCYFSPLANKNNNDECKDDYSDLPPNQRKKKLNQKIDTISTQLNQENSYPANYRFWGRRVVFGGVTEYETEPLPALGTARALYPFDAQSEGSIPMEEKEEFEVVELDQGDGWTRVRRSNMEEGFVPTSYIECFLYNNC
ncbi:formin-binding protein 1-like [Caerostris extrusa]|uniref:Formin-binding protein 1-like n=1 Tax=Caerostris extrusa TaxID=172846 RepID=A0AAV4QU55_CAEEX|nr:formin-binding protein 1-like [Caerostris extrusa]